MATTTFVLNKALHPKMIRDQIHICIILINRAIRNHDEPRENELLTELENLSTLELSAFRENK